ncbi:MAG: hypothetical protein ABRQ26_08435 [Syntrophomonadaceae bacterium]
MFKRSFIGYNTRSVDEHKENYESQMNEQLEQIDRAVNAAVAEQSELSEQLKSITQRIDASLLGTVLISKYQDDLTVVLNEFRAAAHEKMASNQSEMHEFTREINRQIQRADEQITEVKAKIVSLCKGITGALDCPENDLAEINEGTVQIKESINRFTERVEESGVSMVNLKAKGNSSHVEGDAYAAPVFSAGSTMNWKSVRQTMGDDNSSPGDVVAQFLDKLRKAWNS